MHEILDDNNKFKKLGPVSKFDKTPLVEAKLRIFINSLKKKNKLSPEECDLIRPTGNQRPRLYGLPKTHKVGIPLRPILRSMVNSAQHKLNKLNQLSNSFLSIV